MVDSETCNLEKPTYVYIIRRRRMGIIETDPRDDIVGEAKVGVAVPTAVNIAFKVDHEQSPHRVSCSLSNPKRQKHYQIKREVFAMHNHNGNANAMLFATENGKIKT